ncbi:class I SAM-dependent methyltransferase [Candidatus Pacearchaeota archaeon]|nr:class I SAM-dependent methyltransferase [Candidatus Pacearchaeota archaeon]
MTDIKHTREIYDKFSEHYHDYVTSKKNTHHRFIEKPAMLKLLKNEIKGKIVLDLGCGTGFFTKKIFSLGAKEIIGSDLSPNLIQIAKKENPEINFYIGDSRKTSFKKSQFHVINSSLMVHYLQNLNSLFKEVSRILKKNGLFVFSMHHPVYDVVHRENISGKKIRVFKNYFHNQKYYWDLGPKMKKMIAYHHTFEMIFDALNKNGFIVEKLLEPTAPKKAEKFNKKLYSLSNQRPTFLLIKARKIK